MNKPIQDLNEEHGGILRMLKIMDAVAVRIKDGQEVKREHLEKIVEFLKIFADKCHHGKEEGILFPELAGIASENSLINELLGEHKTSRDLIRGIAESLEKFSAGNSDAYHVAVNAQVYSRLLTEHIRKEGALFIVADKELSEKTQAEIAERFEKLEQDVIGPGKHEEYHGWLKELTEIYSS